MAVLAVVKDQAIGLAPSEALRCVRVTITGDAAYPAGGWPIDTLLQASVKDLGTGKPIAMVELFPSDGNFRWKYDRATGKIKVWNTTNNVEAAVALAALDGDTCEFLAIFV